MNVFKLGPKLHTQVINMLRKQGWNWRSFRYSHKLKQWVIGKNMTVGRSLIECRENLQITLSKRES